MTSRGAELPNFTDNLTRLLETYRWVDGGRPVGFTTASLAAALRAAGYAYSDSYIHQLRNGEKANPAAVLIAGLSRVFDVDVRYWFDPEITARTCQELDRRLEALRSGDR